MDYTRFSWLAAEGPRLAFQLSRALLSRPETDVVIRGDGHPIVVLPGFCCGNISTAFMRRALRQRGHNVIPWTCGHNMGITDEMVCDVVKQVSELAWANQQPVSLLGQSLGGCVSRVVANMIPHEVRQVVTLGSPINGVTEILDSVKMMYNARTIGSLDAQTAWETYYNMIVDNPPVPCTSVYSKSDGVVGWRESIQVENDITENIEVGSSHLTMGFDIDVINIVADRLAQPENQWNKYNG